MAPSWRVGNCTGLPAGTRRRRSTGLRWPTTTAMPTSSVAGWTGACSRLHQGDSAPAARGAEAIMTTDVSHRVEKLPAASNLGDDDEARQEWLVAPAIHDAAVLPVHDMMARLRDLGEQGVESVHGVIYPPQVALVGAGRIVQRPLGGRRPAGRKTVRDAHSRGAPP